MSTSAPEVPRAESVEVRRGELVVQLEDGRSLSVPLNWFPRLRRATRAQLSRWRLIGEGVGIHWPQLDEDISVKGLLMPDVKVRAARKSA